VKSLKATKLLHLFKFIVLTRNNRFIALERIVRIEKIAKSQLFKGDKATKSLHADSFLEGISVALIDSIIYYYLSLKFLPSV
jgi:hypothetical protein